MEKEEKLVDEGLFQGDIVTSKRILYTPSPFARNALLYLQETGELKAKKPHVSHRQGLASYLFFYGAGRAWHPAVSGPDLHFGPR